MVRPWRVHDRQISGSSGLAGKEWRLALGPFFGELPAFWEAPPAFKPDPESPSDESGDDPEAATEASAQPEPAAEAPSLRVQPSAPQPRPAPLEGVIEVADHKSHLLPEDITACPRKTGVHCTTGPQVH
mmetsp:Transcript_28858/g.45239  ORF Transcript_28858/g.45239 Transcript_28858/m.45239 type:complete len:129 (+) Transcript_28858:135-521(+)